jgi:hypothetical protein
MRRRSPLRVGWLLLLVALASLVGLSGAAADQFPASAYLPPVTSHGGALDACPNPAGLERFTVTTRQRAVQIAGNYDRIGLAVDLRNSDRAWWPHVRELWRSGKPAKGAANQVVDGSSLGSDIAYSGVVRFSCGSSLVAKSLTVYLAPPQRHGCNACVSSVFFIDRRGHALIYWSN